MPDASLPPLQRWIDTFPATNAKQVAFLALTFTTFALVCAIMLITLAIALHAPAGTVVTVPGIVIDALDSWLLFLSALGGLSVAQFYAKRKTYAAPSPDSERADVPATPAPSEPSKTVAPVVIAAPIAESTAAPVAAPVALPARTPATLVGAEIGGEGD